MASTHKAEAQLPSSSMQQPGSGSNCKYCKDRSPGPASSSNVLHCAPNVPQLLNSIEESSTITFLGTLTIIYSRSYTIFRTDKPSVLTAITESTRIFSTNSTFGQMGRPSHPDIHTAITPTSAICLFFRVLLAAFISFIISSLGPCNEYRASVEPESEPNKTKLNRIPEEQDANHTIRKANPTEDQKANSSQEPSRPHDVGETTPAGEEIISCQPPAQNDSQSLPEVPAHIVRESERTSTDRRCGINTKRGHHTDRYQTHFSSWTCLSAFKLKTRLGPTRKTTSHRGRKLSLCTFREALEMCHSKRKQTKHGSHSGKRKGKPLSQDAEDADGAKTPPCDESLILKELVSAPTMRFANGVCVQLCTAAQDQREERVRLASFYKNEQSIPRTGVWVTRLAAAGFFCPQTGSQIVRCAFCDVSVDMSRFVNTDPAVVHRLESPDCSLVKGRAIQNVPFQQRGQEAALHWLKSLNSAASASDRRRSSSEQQETRNDSEKRSGPWDSVNHIPSPQPPTLSSLAGQNISLANTTSQAQQPQTTSASQPQPVAASCPQTQTVISSASNPSPTPHVSVDRSSPDRGSLISGPPSLPLPPPPPPPSSSQTSTPAPTALSYSAAGDLLAAHVQTDIPHSAEQVPAADSSSATENQYQRAAGQTVDSSRSASLSRPAYTQHMDSYIPYQTAQLVDPSEQQQQQNGTSSNAPGGSGSPQSTQSATRQLVTYMQLGIYTQEPKRPDMAVCAIRLNTFDNPEHPWPRPDTHKPEDMAEAGFYYVGKDDTVRCFHCKGGLQMWADSPDPWVEHAQHFPQCPYVCQVKGQEFVDAVQALKVTRNSFTTKDVDEELERKQRETPANINQASVTEDETPVDGAEGGAEDTNEMSRLSEIAEELENENMEMINTRVCKICRVNDVSILFLPCGHLVSCAQCSPALRTCALCRQRVKGRVRINMKTSG